MMDDPVTAHALRHGLPVCGFTHMLPIDWPTGHVWVSYIEWSSFAAELQANAMRPGNAMMCRQCFERMETRTRPESRLQYWLPRGMLLQRR